MGVLGGRSEWAFWVGVLSGRSERAFSGNNVTCHEQAESKTTYTVERFSSW